MQREDEHINGRGWRDWRPVMVLGLPLGLLELGLFAVTVTRPLMLPSWNALLYDWLLYFLIAGVIEYQFCWRRRHEGWDTSVAGFLAALVGCAVFMLSVTVWLIISIVVYDHTPHPPPPPPVDPQDIIPLPTQDPSRAFILLTNLAFLNIVALAFSAVGARIGNALATWRKDRLSE